MNEVWRIGLIVVVIVVCVGLALLFRWKKNKEIAKTGGQPSEGLTTHDYEVIIFCFMGVIIGTCFASLFWEMSLPPHNNDNQVATVFMVDGQPTLLCTSFVLDENQAICRTSSINQTEQDVIIGESANN